MALGTVLALGTGMNSKTFFIPALALASVAAALVAPSPSSGQAGGEDAALASLLSEVTAQQAVLAENQAQIDVKIAAVAENVRQTRIFSSRSR